MPTKPSHFNVLARRHCWRRAAKVLLIIFSAATFAYADTRGEPELRICSQNLQNFGAPPARGRSRNDVQQSINSQLRVLVRRMVEAECQVVAVQEVFGRTTREAERSIAKLARALERATDTRFVPFVGEGIDKRIRNGFLVAENAGVILDVHSEERTSLPKIQPVGRASVFLRAPLVATLRVPSRSGAGAKEVTLINIHFKSKAQSWKDLSGNEFETTRMEMAEAVRNIAASFVTRHKSAIVVVLGDRNADADSASAAILKGTRVLDDFRHGACHLQRDLSPSCMFTDTHRPLLVGVAEERVKRSGGGSYRYRNELSLIDEILVAPDNLWMFRAPDGSTAAGFTGRFNDGSDHKLLWAELNW